MASSDPEIKDGFSLPVWMKTKPSKEFEPFASSPPAPEDTFFYIRYPKSDVLFGKPKFNADIPKALNEPKDFAQYVIKDQDWSKHTKPCQEVLNGIAPINTAAKSVNVKPKPAGTDDGFKGEGAACGSSVVKVAHQMISSRGFTVATPADSAPEPVPRLTRRGSRSLPATPATSPHGSPTSRRRMVGNRYFTSPFEPSEDASRSSWLTMALLGFKKDLTTSTSTLAEEEAEHRLQCGSLAESVENLGPSKQDPKLINDSTPSKTSKPSNSYRPKPSELREMNFWSPTCI
ncbi:unnamed protein product [Danaus chrysippus]|uniref:(African queen) hypothetical protein n=1 Tax=Danaus chrysippus TaxID=151541 RepID=A0A8J2QMV3_9NEOP|nr:unnamed protein product [Danaus chrysippus]